MEIVAVVGARPNFMKIAPVHKALQGHDDLHLTLVHTGQHYDEAMSDAIFRELQIPHPDIHLGVGGGSHAEQTAAVMLGFDRVLEGRQVDMVVVVGDVNSTLAAALVAAKRLVPVAHVEAGLRSGDRTMPEELNRLLTDQLSDLLFTTELSARTNLLAEGIADEKIHFVGNVMIDNLLGHRERARAAGALQKYGVQARKYALCTLHRPSNVDDLTAATRTVAMLKLLVQRMPVLLPLHPRTRLRWKQFGLLEDVESTTGIMVSGPLGYLEFLGLMDEARLVLTDSGGIQEETTALGVPCLTYRENTERPITISEGSNRLVGTNPDRVVTEVDAVLAGPERQNRTPALWDGRSADRIVAKLHEWHTGKSSAA